MIIQMFCPNCLDKHNIVICDGYNLDGTPSYNNLSDEIVRSIKHTDKSFCIATLSKKIMDLQFGLQTSQDQIQHITAHLQAQKDLGLRGYYPLLVARTEIPYNLEKPMEE